MEGRCSGRRSVTSAGPQGSVLGSYPRHKCSWIGKFADYTKIGRVADSEEGCQKIK